MFLRSQKGAKFRRKYDPESANFWGAIFLRTPDFLLNWPKFLLCLVRGHLHYNMYYANHLCVSGIKVELNFSSFACSATLVLIFLSVLTMHVSEQPGKKLLSIVQNVIRRFCGNDSESVAKYTSISEAANVGTDHQRC